MINPTHDPSAAPVAGRRPIVVLLVDDQPFVGNVVGLLLKSELDIELHCCLVAGDAIAVANQIGPTLILQDLVMPGIDGFTLLNAFRCNPQTAATPVIVLSANDDAVTHDRALAEGANGYLVKLPPKAELIAYLRDHASRSTIGRDTLDPAVIATFLDAGAPDFTRRLIEQFLAEAALRVRTLLDAAGRADAAAMKAVAHSLKGSSMIIGASRLAALCGQVEAQLASPTAALAPGVMGEIGRELVRVEHALATQRDLIAP
jgi:CheY-like chemotaxis protein/HPt (histidine-containing phosphotransfer) domain-containing protein